MNLLKLKLPKIKSPRDSRNNEKEITFIKLTPIYKEPNRKIIKIPKNLRTINYNNYQSTTKFETNEINNSIKSFLRNNISIKHNLRPIINIKQSFSTRHLSKAQKLSPNKEHLSRKRNPNEINNMNNFINKLDKIFGTNSHLKVVNDINKELFKENEGDTHGNRLYNDSEEEKKDSIVYYLDKNNVKKMIKTKLTKKVKIQKNLTNIRPYKDLENIRIKTSKFTPFGYENIQKIKFFENFAQERLRGNLSPNNVTNLCISESKRNKLKMIIKKKLKDIGNEMNDNQNNLQNIKKLIETSIKKARKQIDFVSNEIDKEMNS